MGERSGRDRLWRSLLALRRGAPEAMPADPADAAFWRLHAELARAPRFVLAQLGQSLDGRIATPGGHSHGIGCPEAIAHLHRLRALCDAVVVGIGTVLADDPRLTVRDVAGDSPARIVIDPRGRLPAEARLLAPDGRRRLVVHGPGGRAPEGAESVVLGLTDGQIAPTDIVAALADRGFRRLLIEGGACTVSRFVAAGAVDRLHVCVAPIVIGSGLPGLTLPPIAGVGEALRPAAEIHRLGRDVLFDLALR